MRGLKASGWPGELRVFSLGKRRLGVNMRQEGESQRWWSQTLPNKGQQPQELWLGKVTLDIRKRSSSRRVVQQQEGLPRVAVGAPCSGIYRFGWTKLTWHSTGCCPTMLLWAENCTAPLLWTPGVIIPLSPSILLLGLALCSFTSEHATEMLSVAALLLLFTQSRKNRCWGGVALQLIPGFHFKKKKEKANLLILSA